jgi:hypothetical protein
MASSGLGDKNFFSGTSCELEMFCGIGSADLTGIL